MNGLKIIKLTVFLLGIFILFAVGLCTKTIYDKQNTAFPSEISLMQPEGSYIKNIVAAQKDLYIMVSGGGISDRVVVFSPKKGKVIYNISIN